MSVSITAKKDIYLIYDKDSLDVVVSYKTPAYNTSKAIYTTRASASKACKYLNSEEDHERYKVYGFGR